MRGEQAMSGTFMLCRLNLRIQLFSVLSDHIEGAQCANHCLMAM